MHQAVLSFLNAVGHDTEDCKKDSKIGVASILSKQSKEFDLLLHFTEVDELIELECEVKLRCPVNANPRVSTYLDKLKKSLAALNVDVVVNPPRTISVKGLLSENMGEEHNANFTDIISFCVNQYVQILYCATKMVELSYRLPQRCGTNQYRKVLPSKMVLLTVYGQFDHIPTIH